MNTMSRRCATALVFGLAALAAAFGFDQGSAQPLRPAPPTVETSNPIGIPVWACKPVTVCCPLTPACELSMPAIDPRSTAPPPIGVVAPGCPPQAPTAPGTSGR